METEVRVKTEDTSLSLGQSRECFCPAVRPWSYSSVRMGGSGTPAIGQILKDATGIKDLGDFTTMLKEVEKCLSFWCYFLIHMKREMEVL